MSNMAKKGKVEVEGFLHDVSEMIQSGDRCKYFTALLQEAQRNCRVVIFDHMKHNTFRSAEKDRTPVKLCDVAFSPSRQKKGEMDIMVNSSSSVRCVRQLDFMFDESLHEVVQDVTVDYILKDPREYQRVNVTVKIVRMTEDQVCVTRSHQKMKKRCYDVADKTQGIALCVWGGDILSNGKCYYLTNVSVRQFGGETSITTTAQSEMTVLDLDMEVHGAVNNVKVFEGRLITAEVKVDYMCPKQHVLQNVNLDTAITRCHQCVAYCKTAAIVAVLRTKVTIEDSSGKMTDFGIEDYVLRQLLNLGSERLFETDLLVSKLLVEDRIQLQSRGNRITAAAFLPPCAPSTNERDRASESATTASCSTTLLPPCAPSTNERDRASESATTASCSSTLLPPCALSTNERDRASESATTASCSTPLESEDDLMLEEFFRSETVELDGVNEKDTEKVEVDGKGTMLDCKRKESVEGTVEKEVEVLARPKHVKCDRNLKHPGKTGKKK